MLYPTLVFIHVAAVLGFVGIHSVSAAVSWRVQGESDRARLSTLLRLSEGTYPWMLGSLGLIVLSGIALGILGGWWRHVWFWAALVLLVALSAGMGAVGNQYRRLRAAVSADPINEREVAAAEAAAHVRLAVIGVAGLAILLWLMVFKPF